MLFRPEHSSSKLNSPRQVPKYHDLRRKSFLLHMRPSNYSSQEITFSNTYYLGFLTFFLFLIEITTGVILMVYYSPTPDQAYESITRLTTEVPFGWLLRDLHRFGGECMIALSVFHMARVFIKGAYHNERRITWVTGAMLLLCTLTLGFSGYLLPWDQLAFWAVTIGTSMVDTVPGIGENIGILLRGGPIFGADGLLRFYLLHVIAVPFATCLLLAIHYYRISRLHKEFKIPDSTSNPIRRKKTIHLFPDLALRELTLALFSLSALIVFVTFFYDAPLEHHADPQHTPAAASAPWFFLWLQGALKLGNSFYMGICFPFGVLLAMITAPYIDPILPKVLRKEFFRIVIVSVLFSGFLGLSFLGLPGYGVDRNPLAELFQKIAPEQKKSIFHRLEYRHLVPGVYETHPGSEADEKYSSFSDWLISFQRDVELLEQQGNFKAPKGMVLVEEWQADLKRITVRVHWTEPSLDTENGHKKSSSIQVFVYSKES